MYVELESELLVEMGTDKFSEAVQMAGMSAITVNVTCFDWSVDLGEGTDVELEITAEGSDDLQNWDDLSGATAGKLIEFTALGYDSLTVPGIAHQYVRLKFSWVWTDPPNSAIGILAAGINTANV